MFSTEPKGRHEENTITVILICRSLTGKGLVIKNSTNCINASPLSPNVLEQGYSKRACYYVVIVAYCVFKC